MLQHADPFELYNTPSQKYDAIGGSPTISTTNPRTGAQSLKTVGGNIWVQKNLPLSQTKIVGVGVDITAGFAEGSIFSFLDGNTVQASIFCDGSGHLQAWRGIFGASGAVLLGTSVQAMSIGTYHYIEAKVKVDPSVGTVDIHLDGVSFLSLTGQNTRITASSQIGAVTLGYLTFGGGTVYWDDYYILDDSGSYNNTFLGPTAILALLPTGNGTLNQWAIGGSAPAATNYQSVNENPPDDGVTFVQDGTVGDIDRYTFPSIASSYPTLVVGTISAVVVGLRAELDTPGTRSIRGAVLSGGTAGTTPSDLALTPGWADYEGVLETDPNTGLPWAEAAVDAAEFGQKVTA